MKCSVREIVNIMTLSMIRTQELGLYLPTSFIIVVSDGAPASISSQALSDMVSSPKPIIISISSSVLSDWLASNRMRRRSECIKSAFLVWMFTTPIALVLALFSPLSVDCKVVKHQLLVDGALVEWDSRPTPSRDRWTEKPLPLPTHKKQAKKNTTREEERLVIVEWVLPRTARELCHLPCVASCARAVLESGCAVSFFINPANLRRTADRWSPLPMERQLLN